MRIRCVIWSDYRRRLSDLSGTGVVKISVGVLVTVVLVVATAGISQAAASGQANAANKSTVSNAPTMAEQATASQKPQVSQAGKSWVDGYISPAFTQFHHQAKALHVWLEQGCDAQRNNFNAETKRRFQSLVQAWSGVAFLRFGPLVADNRYERLSFWPDPRGVMLRQITGTMARYKKETTEIPLGERSVAIQGLPALEYVLYGTPGLLTQPLPQEERAGLCRYAIALAANISNVAQQLEKNWALTGPYAEQFMTPGSSNALYRVPDEVVAEGVKALSTGLQFVRDIQLAPAFQAVETGLAFKRAPYWRSGLTSSAVQASLNGMRDFLLSGPVPAGQQAWITNQLAAELKRAADQAASLPALAQYEVLDASEVRQQWLLLGRIVNNAKSLTDDDLASALGVQVGFNALDGD